MKIEKINDNQIRCILTAEDLAERQIKISELAYGTEKAKLLFRDMVQQASYEFGFEAEDIPLMIEAVPMSADMIVLTITKVEQPDELDTRFSKFSEPSAEDIYGSASGDFRGFPPEGADDILALLREMQAEEEEEERSHGLGGDRESYQEAKGFLALEEREDAGKNQIKAPVGITRLFVFYDLSEAMRLARVLNGFYEGKNDLYKNPVSHRYYLLVEKDGHTPEEFNKVCNILSEYASQRTYTLAARAFFEEHYQKMIEGDALQTLAGL